MIKGDLIHPEILKVLASAGHGAKILIADGHFPFSTGAAKNVPRVYLNFATGKLNTIDILSEIVKAVPIESTTAVVPDDGNEPAIFEEYRKLLPEDIEINKVKRFGFYDAVNTPELALVIASAEKRTYACILLTIGIREFEVNK